MLSPGAAIGRYVIHKKLAEGGMAEVYLASATGPEGFSKDVVIKVVRAFLASDQQFIDMFVAEARLSSRLNHANVVQIFDFGKADDSYYLAMEYVRGASLWDLRKRCRERGVPFPPTLAAEIGSQVARGLHHAHSLSVRGTRLGIVHRDVTPHNVLLSFDGAIKLTDFGIAKAGSTHTAPGILKGKFAYMSPEQARGEVVDARSDVFAMGIVLWELLTGGRLFDGESELAVLRAVQDSVITPPGRLNPEVPDDLTDIVLRALARPLETRFQTAFELERALANFVLRQAKTVEDTSASLFLQQMFREEYEAMNQSHGGLDELAHRATPLAEVRRAHANETTQPPLALAALEAGAPGPPTEQVPGVVVERPATDGPQAPKTTRAPPVVDESVDLNRSPSRRLPPVVAEPPAPRTPPLRSPSRKLPTLEARPPGPHSPSRKLPTLNGERPVSRKLEPPQERPAHNQSEPAQTLPPDADETLDKPPRRPVLGAVVVGLVVVVGTVGAWFVSLERPPIQPLEVAVAPEPAPVPVALVAEPESERTTQVDAGPETADEMVIQKPVGGLDAGGAAVKASPPLVTATLEVKAVPYAMLSIDGQGPLEIQGSQLLRLPVGPHELVLKHPLKTARERVMLKAGQAHVIAFDAMAP